MVLKTIKLKTNKTTFDSRQKECCSLH